MKLCSVCDDCYGVVCVFFVMSTGNGAKSSIVEQDLVRSPANCRSLVLIMLARRH